MKWEAEDFFYTQDIYTNMGNIYRTVKMLNKTGMSYFAKYRRSLSELAAEYKKWHDLDVTDELLNSEEF